MLNGTNFNDWKRYLEIVLGCMDNDLSLRVEQPASLTAESNPDERKDFERWDSSNRMSLMIMKHIILETFRGTESEKITLAKDFLDNIEQKFAKNDKVEMTSLLTSLMSMKYKEEERLKRGKSESAHLASTSKDKGKKRKDQNEAAKERLYQISRMACKERYEYNLVCSEVNLASVPRNTWWIDSGATTHISISMQGCLSYRKPSDGERNIFVGDGKSVEVEAIGHFRLLLGTDKVASYNETLHVESCGTKHKLNKENSASLWHKRLGHISKGRIDRLVSNDVLELIHTDIFGPFPSESWNGQQYFITFIDDYSRYGYLYLIHEKSQSLDVFKSYKAEVENQHNKRIKKVRSDRGGEYYGRYDGSGEQRPGPFAKFLEECGIVPQYSMSGSPSMNGVAERRNRTLKDMDVEFGGRNKVRDIAFEEDLSFKLVPTITFDDVQVPIPIINQEVNPELNKTMLNNFLLFKMM
ncbi:hypothetical protein GQ457_18G006850 [Hibiscus cannabinus]